MRSTGLSIAGLSGVLLFGVFGASLGGRAPQHADLHPSGAGAGVGVQSHSPIKKHETTTKTTACISGMLCDDPVVRAGKLATQEANEKLKVTICNFLAEYGVPDETLAKAIKRSKRAPQNNTYCIYTKADKAEGVDPASQLPVNKAVRPTVIVAVLPDPVHTQLALRFDESIDELQNSMQDMGWTYDRAWLPWENKEHEEAADFDQRMENKISQEQYETIPGAILFRDDPNEEPTRNEEPRRPLIVLVVGDTPTGGVNAGMFRNAIAIWKQLTGWKNYFGGRKQFQAYDASTLSILGPTYSGSTSSLMALLREVTVQAGGNVEPDGYACPSKDFHIFISSGTISDSEGIANLENDPELCSHLQVAPSSFAADINYEKLQILQYLYQHFSCDSGGACQFAFLGEVESRFGANVLHDPAPDPIQKSINLIKNQLNTDIDLSDSSKQQLERQLAEKRRDLDAARREVRIAPHYYRFPREISKLRAAYEQNNIFGFGSESNSVRTQLHLSLSGNAREDDTVHTFSGAQEPAAMEAEMSQLAAELERQKIRVVLLSATDVLDEIFVTRYLSQHAPNVSVIVTDTDNLFLRGGDASMENAYVIGPWPLMPGNEEWSAPPFNRSVDSRALPPVRIHDSAGGQGSYAAARFLICRLDAMPLQECGPNTSTKPGVSIREYQPPVATWAAKTNDLKAEPPLWLSAVGRGGFWPISLVDVDQAADGLPESAADNLPRLMEVAQENGDERPLPEIQSRGIQESTPRSITIATGLIALLLAFHGLACLRARLDRGYAWSYALSHQVHHRWRQALQITITMSVVPALVLLKTRIEAGITIRSPHYTEFNWTLQVIVFLLTLPPLALLVKAWPWPETKKQQTVAMVRFIGSILVEMAFIFACNWWLWDVIAPSPHKWPTERAFFFYRSGHLFCGSAPSLPLLLLGGAFVVYVVRTFDRLVFYRHRIPMLPKSDPELNCPNRKRVQRLNQLLSDTRDRWRLGLLLVVSILLALFVAELHDIIPRTLAHGRFDVAIISLSGGVVFLLMYDLAVAITAWLMLRADCLLPLSRSPLRWGFTWIKGWSWKRIWTPSAISNDRVLEYLRRLAEANHRKMEEPVLTNAFVTLRQQFGAMPRDARWANNVMLATGHLNCQIALSASRKLVHLKKVWGRDYGPITGSDASERGLLDEVPLDKRDPDDPARRKAWVATHDRMAKEEFVALLYLGYIRMVLLQIRNRIMTALGMYILLLWALTSYPFLNHHYVVVGLTCLLMVLAATVIWIYAQMYRDDILSRTTQTTPGKLDVDFFTKILSMVGIPLLTLIASQFPEVSNAVFSWLEPGLSSVK